MKLIIIFLSLFSAGCAILQSTSLTEVDTSTVDHPVVFSESSSFGLLHLELATEYSRYNITKTLASECVGGKIYIASRAIGFKGPR